MRDTEPLTALPPDPTRLLPPIRRVLDLPVPRDVVYGWWTTVEGLRSFFAPDARIALCPRGPFEILFDLDSPPGEQGSEGCEVLAFVPGELLVVSWSAPPPFPAERAEIDDPQGARPFVCVRLTDGPEGGTRLVLDHGGLPDRDRWPEVRLYFERAWDAVVGWIQHRATVGPMDWTRLSAM